MVFSKLKVLKSHGKQYIPDLQRAQLPPIFRGRPEITAALSPEEAKCVAELCPTGAISCDPLAIDLGRCLFCGECARCVPHAIRFTNDYRLGTNDPARLLVTADSPEAITLDADRIRHEIRSVYGRSLRLREVSAGGDNATEMELNATQNTNFDFARYGIEFAASPRHADGLVVTGPITENMAIALELAYHAVADPKVLILAGTDAISGGLFAESPALNRSFLDRFHPDLLLPGNPVHPLTFIHGVMALIGRKW